MLEELKQKVLDLFYQDKPLEAHQFLQTLQEAYDLTDFLEKEEIKLLTKDVATLQTFLKEEQNQFQDPSWTRFYDEPEYKIYYRYVQGEPLCSLYLERVIEAPLLNLMALLAEAQLYTNWVPRCSKS